MSITKTQFGDERPSVGKDQENLVKLVRDKTVKPKRVNFEVTPEQHMKLKLYATKQGKTITDILSEYVALLPD